MGVIEEIFRQFNQGHGEWHQFIESIKIDNIHGWHEQEIHFDYPVVAIVGENGIGKSTFLKAAACAYKRNNEKDFYPSKMFMSTQWDEDAMDGATIEYKVRIGNVEKNLRWKKTKDWGFTPKTKKPSRDVYFLDISRTLPLDATAGYAKIAMTSNAEVGEGEALSVESIRDLSRVLGQTYSNARFVETNVDSSREVGLLTREYGEISQFHQGAGEDAMLDMFKLLQDIPNQALLIIDEVENSLHPRAQRRFVQHLLEVARRKKLQIILSTHSPFVLEELPPVARVMLFQLADRKEIVYGVSSAFALSTIDECQHPEVYVHFEDDEAVVMFWEILKRNHEVHTDLVKRIETRTVGSATVVNTLAKLAKDRNLPYASISIVDGDMKNNCRDCLCLPCDLAPEKAVFEGLKEKGWNDLDERFGIGAGTLFSYLDDVITSPDHHQWTTILGDKIKKSKDVVWAIMVEEWCKQCLPEQEGQQFIEQVQKAIQEAIS